jgi:AcrR family transcriptional regulator
MTARQKKGNQQTRQAILDALERVLETRNLDVTGVTEILAEAGLSSRTSYYHHFGSRDEAFVALAEHALTEIGNDVRAAIEDPHIRSTAALRDAVDTWIARGRRHGGLARNMITEWPRIPQLKVAYVSLLAQLSSQLAVAIDTDRRAGRIITPLPSQVLAATVLWSAERAVYATMVGARGFSSTAATADALVAQHLALVYGVPLNGSEPAAAQ